MSGRTIVTMVAIALGVTLGYHYYQSKRGNA
jgi:hypothetical protein